MIIRTLDELAVYQKEQLAASSSQAPALIAAGFEQKTDRHFAHYLYLARGSAKETKTHLIVAVKRRHLSTTECESLGRDYVEIAKMSSGLIEHLEQEDRKHRQPRRNRTLPPNRPTDD